MPGAMDSTARFNPTQVRDYLRKRGMLPENIVRYCYRPFDVRWLYWEPETKLLDEKRSEYFPHVLDGNIFLFTTGRTRKEIIEPALSVRTLSDLNCMDSGARGFPLYLRRATPQLFDEGDPSKPIPNLSDSASAYLTSLGVSEQQLFYHCLSTLHSPIYRQENVSAIRLDWPRIPLPEDLATLMKSAELGQQVAALLDPITPVGGVTSGTISTELRLIGSITRVGGGGLNVEAGDLVVTAGWGFGGQGGVTMAGKGKAHVRDYTAQEQEALADAAFGDKTCDVYLNEVAYWQNIPTPVWEYTMGGYQVLKKWLSYRERKLLGRSLTVNEVREFTAIARRIAALLLMEADLNANYQQVKMATFDWANLKKGDPKG